jgi:UDP-N-acetylmuramyl pentapeptide phosphotransferase/UDP-N-acetylglucosamine-1-phosphate transferase
MKFWVHFFCGALLGALCGFFVWGRSSYSSSASLMPGSVFVGGGALLLGLTAGIESDTGDHFWHSLRDWFRW